MNKAKNRKRRVTKERMLTISELAYYVGTPSRTIREMVDVELISPCVTKPELCFSTSILPVVQRIIRIQRTMEIDVSSLPVVIDLLDRIEQLERKLMRFRSS